MDFTPVSLQRTIFIVRHHNWRSLLINDIIQNIVIDYENKKAEVPLPSYLGEGSVVFNNIGKVNIIFGPNGSGKSHVVRVLNGEDSERHHLISPERPGDFTYIDAYARDEERGSSRIKSRVGNLTTDYRQRVYSRLSSYLKARGTLSTPDHTTHYERISEFIAILLPDFEFDFYNQVGKDFIIRHRTGEQEASIANMSSGEADLFAVGLDMISICLMWRIYGQVDPILFLDEPNVHLHPDLDEKLAIALKFLVDNYGIRLFVASHSTSLLSSLVNTFDDDARLFYMKRGQREVMGLKPSEELRRLSTILGGGTVLGGLFGLKVLLVEGDDDFEVWNQVARSSRALGLSVLPPAGGKAKQRKAKATLESLFTSLGFTKTMGYLLQDRDGRVGNPTNKSGDLITSLWLGCREVENLYLTDEVLSALGYENESAKTKLIEGGLSEELVSRIFADKISTPEIKSNINKISAILGHKFDRWQQRVGKTIGAGKPSGELAEFLSAKLVAEWWQD